MLEDGKRVTLKGDKRAMAAGSSEGEPRIEGEPELRGVGRGADSGEPTETTCARRGTGSTRPFFFFYALRVPAHGLTGSVRSNRSAGSSGDERRVDISHPRDSGSGPHKEVAQRHQQKLPAGSC